MKFNQSLDFLSAQILVVYLKVPGFTANCLALVAEFTVSSPYEN